MHLRLDQREYENLFVLVEETISVHVKDLHEISCCLDTEQVINCFLVPFEDKVNVGFIQSAFSSEVCLLNGIPDVSGLSGSTHLHDG